MVLIFAIHVLFGPFL